MTLRNSGSIRVLACLVFAAAWSCSADAEAASISMDVIPSLRLEQGWDSNVFNASSDEISSFYFRVAPGLALRFRTSDNVTFQISGTYDKYTYYSSDAKDADSADVYFRLDSSGAVNISRNLSVVPSAYYLNSTNSSRRSELLPSADPVVPPVSISTYANTRSQDFGGGLDFRYLVTPNTTFGLAGRYGERRFSTNTEGLTDSTTAGGNLLVSQLVTPSTTLGIGVGGSHDTFETGGDTNVVSAGVLFGHQFSAAFRLDARVGYSWLQQGASATTPEESTSAPAGNINASYSSGTFIATAFLQVGYTGGSGYGQATREGTVGFTLSDRFAREWSWDLSGNYQISRSEFDTNAIDLVTVNGLAGIRYQPWEWGTFDLTGRLTDQRSDGQLGSSQTQYTLALGFTIGVPYNFF